MRIFRAFSRCLFVARSVPWLDQQVWRWTAPQIIRRKPELYASASLLRVLGAGESDNTAWRKTRRWADLHSVHQCLSSERIRNQQRVSVGIIIFLKPIELFPELDLNPRRGSTWILCLPHKHFFSLLVISAWLKDPCPAHEDFVSTVFPGPKSLICFWGSPLSRLLCTSGVKREWIDLLSESRVLLTVRKPRSPPLRPL